MRTKLLAVALVCALSESAAARKYTLPQLISKVRTDYAGVLAARQNVEVAEAVTMQTERAWAPSGSLDLMLFGSGNNKCTPIDPNTASSNQDERERNCYRFSLISALSTGNDIFDQFPRFGVSLGLNLYLNQPLYSFGKIEAGIELSRTAVENARETTRAAIEDAILNVNRAYWGIKAARGARDALVEVLDKLKEWIDKIAVEMDGPNKSGYTEADLARLKTALDGLVLIQLDVDRNLTFAEEGLRVLTDDEEADVDDEELNLIEFVPRPLAWFEDVARLHRPEARMVHLGLNTAAAIRHARRAELLPDLSLVNRLNFSYQSSADSPYNAFMLRINQVNGIWSLLMHMPLDLGVRYQRWKQASIEEQVMILRRKESLGNLGLEVARVWADHEEARQREERVAHGEKVARGWYAIVNTNMAQGLSASTDARELVDAARNYFDLRLRCLQAIMDANVTWASLERVTGVQ